VGGPITIALLPMYMKYNSPRTPNAQITSIHAVGEYHIPRVIGTKRAAPMMAPIVAVERPLAYQVLIILAIAASPVATTDVPSMPKSLYGWLSM
jgi:hypothetical protein